jgi:hypothetical protein
VAAKAKAYRDAPEAGHRWPADRVERRPIDSLIPYARNPRQHPPAQIDQLCCSIQEWGWTIPVLIDEDGGIIAGHGRVLAAQKLGLAEVPVMVAVGWTEAQKRAYVIADNQLTLNSDWDTDLLRGELSALKGLEFDVGLLGFGDVQLVEFMSGLPGGTNGIDAAAGAAGGGVSLAERFGVPPFSVLNAREGWWQDRKRAWIALGIQSELGRGDAMPPGGSLQPTINPKTGAKVETASLRGGGDLGHHKRSISQA